MTKRTVINGVSVEEVERRIEDLEKRNFKVVTPCTPKNRDHFEQGNNGQFLHKYSNLSTTYFAVMEYEPET